MPCGVTTSYLPQDKRDTSPGGVAIQDLIFFSLLSWSSLLFLSFVMRRNSLLFCERFSPLSQGLSGFAWEDKSLLFWCFSSEECQKPQPPLLLKKVWQYTLHLYCNTPPICIAVLSVPLGSQEREIVQYASHLYRSAPPICIAMLFGKILVVVVTGMFPISRGRKFSPKF